VKQEIVDEIIHTGTIVVFAFCEQDSYNIDSICRVLHDYEEYATYRQYSLETKRGGSGYVDWLIKKGLVERVEYREWDL